MPRNILRNRVSGCMVESHIGGEQPDEFRVLAANERDVLFSFTTLAAASAGAMAFNGIRKMGEAMTDPDQFEEFTGACGRVMHETSNVLVEKRTQAELSAKAADPAVQQPAVQQQPAATQQGQPAIETPAIETPAVETPASLSGLAAQQPAATQQLPQGQPQQPAAQPQGQPTGQESTDGGADPGRVHVGVEAEVAGGGVDGTQPPAATPPSTPDPEVGAAAPADGVAPASDEPAPGADSVNLL